MDLRMKIASSLILFVCTVLTPATSNAAKAGNDYKNTIAAARETVWKAITTGHGTGATVAVMDNGRIIYSEGIGVADREKNRPVDRNTRFNIASTSKMFAATAVLLLVDDGKVKLDEGVAKYVPEFTMKDPRYKKITVRMLFNHSSGLPGSSDFCGYAGEYNIHELMLDRLKDSWLKHDPGAMSIYCNDGFTLAEMIVEKVSGKKYIDFLRRRVFKPLGMKNTGPNVGEIKSANVAEYYDPKTGKKYPREVVKVYGAGGLSSTAEDLCRFGDSFSGKGKRILSAASLREILRTQPTLFSGKLKDYQMMSEFGWDYSNLRGYREKGIQVLAKGGNSPFYSTNLQVIPERRIVVALSISGQNSGEMLTRPILDALMEDKGIMAAKENIARKPADPQPFPPEFLNYAGLYTNDSSVVRIELDKGNNKVSATPLSRNAKPFTLIYRNGYFHNAERDVNFYFTTVEGNSYLAAHAMAPFGADMLTYQKLEEVKNPVSLKTDMNGKTWLVKNARPYISTVQNVFVVSSSVYKELPGYVDLGGIKKIENAEYASIAATSFRDQSALFLRDRSGETWAKVGIYLYSPAESAPKAASGPNRLAIKKDGWNEWLKINKGALVRMEIPRNGRVLIVRADAILFDSIVDSGEFYAPAGSYVFCAGAPGDVFAIHAR
ncbi:MAG: serine hydrolase domain-containing protein [Syntrophales bacterium]